MTSGHVPPARDTVSDRGLRIFHETHEAGSFTGAARRLGIGQSAVSHAIRSLETSLGARLFERGRGGVTLTAAGTRLHEHLAVAFAEIDRGLRGVRDLSREGTTVTLSVSTSLATFWLLPRLAACKQALPDLELRLLTCDTDRDVGRDAADLWIPHGAGPWPGLEETVFSEEAIAPVATPALAATIVGDDAAALASAPLLHLEERYSPRYDWNRWFEHHGLALGTAGGYRSNDYSLILQAALEGQGVALGWRHIVGPLVADGRLVTIGRQVVRTDRPFTILTRTGPPDAVAALRDWLIAEAAAG